ncbi:hypothetical protein PC112_g13023 [Phytophthora cactorum]|nr:hypothetical protein PC112_g13023 [Phytophthora cactorum]
MKQVSATMREMYVQQANENGGLTCGELAMMAMRRIVLLDYEWLELLASQQYGDGFPVVCRPSQIGFVQHNASLLSTVPFDGLATTA